MVEIQICEVDALLPPFILLNNVLELFSIVEYPWFHRASALVEVTMEIKRQ
jgi:hypothetical protein